MMHMDHEYGSCIIIFERKTYVTKNMSGRYLSSKSLDKIGLEKPMYCSYIVEFYDICNLIERDDFSHT